MRSTADDLIAIADGYGVLFPDGKDPLRIMLRLTEELGEVAAEVAHLESHGAKTAKHGAPDRARLAAEVEDVLHNVFALVRHYGIEDALDAEIVATLARHRAALAEPRS
ncbi:MazG nucleotide pyrophosphohydrolase domain-containing protein [Microbacterium gorillae]|uniref:MazG nucleotide pyrophosphohydrolase domain-containing protein n=1 Tax=Microbacterium gorillae TaxID=1231063 RepID=UPI00058E405A|nr:MazG-like family protein [Microbacterium gorillae]